MPLLARIAAAATVLASGVVALATGAAIPTSTVPGPVAPIHVQFMTRGAAVDSVALRVSLGHDPGFRGEWRSCVIIEELRWPPPQVGIVFDEDRKTFRPAVADPDSACLLAVSRIAGHHLQDECRKLDPPARAPATGVRMRAVDLRVRGVEYPFTFVEWSSPRAFVVEDEIGRYTIRWAGRGVFELAQIERLR